MSVSLILEVAISMAFLYLLGSQVVLSIYELWAGYTNSRGKFLYRRLKGSLGVTTTQTLYAQPPIVALSPAGQAAPTNATEKTAKFWFGKDGLPAYIPANLFASTLLTMVAPAATTQTALLAALAGPPATTPTWVDAKVVELLGQILQGLDANATLEDCQKRVAAWYDAYGERLTGWYKRQVRLWLFLIGLVVAFVGNIDSPFIIRYLWAHPQLSSSIADAATQQAQALDIAKLSAAENNALALNKATSTDSPAQSVPVRQAATIDSLKRRLRVTQAQMQALNNHLHGLGFPIGRADSAGRDSTRLPNTFYVRQPARTVRQGPRLVNIPAFYYQYQRSPQPDATTGIPGITGKSFIWLKKALPVDRVSEKDLAGDADRSEEKPWYEPVFGPQGQSAGATFLGWLLTALALSVGAPFWFDLLCRLVNIRNLGIKPPRPER